jgi:protein-tyrosine phosphatase
MTMAASTAPGGAAWTRAVGAVLRHPWVLPVKQRLKNAVWRWRGRRLENPPLPGTPARVLFLCLGNICRSPFAAALASRLLDEAGLSMSSTSAGLRASQAAASPAEAIEAAAAYSIRLDEHRPVNVTVEALEASDIVFVMEVWQIDAVRRLSPAAAGRVHLLPLYEPNRRVAYGGFEQCHLVDPFGQNREAFVRCYHRIDAALRGFVAALRTARTSAGEGG